MKENVILNKSILNLLLHLKYVLIHLENELIPHPINSLISYAINNSIIAINSLLFHDN